MAKKRKLKKSAIIVIGIIVFFVIYIIAFNIGTNMDKQPETTTTKPNSNQEDNRILKTQIMSKNDIYINYEEDEEVSAVKVDEEYWKEVKYFFGEFSEVRAPKEYTAKYVGNSDDGLRFSTDLNYFRVYNVNKEEYYKIPVGIKTEFEKILNKSIYTSFDFIKQYKSWHKVSISSSEGKTKNIFKWKFDDIAYKMASKRIVGKIQPEKNKERSKYNFVIDIKGKDYEVKVETMGKDYVKITSHGDESYYEVHTGLFEYLKDEVFKITE